jgi:hypothetical protein
MNAQPNRAALSDRFLDWRAKNDWISEGNPNTQDDDSGPEDLFEAAVAFLCEEESLVEA